MYLLDVSGHGVPSALLSVSVTYSLSARASLGSLITRLGKAGPQISAPKDVAGRLNELYPMASNNNHYFTLAFGILDLAERRVHCVTAGHPGPALQYLQHRCLIVGLECPDVRPVSARGIDEDVRVGCSRRLHA